MFEHFRRMRASLSAASSSSMARAPSAKWPSTISPSAEMSTRPWDWSKPSNSPTNTVKSVPPVGARARRPWSLTRMESASTWPSNKSKQNHSYSLKIQWENQLTLTTIFDVISVLHLALWNFQFIASPPFVNYPLWFRQSLFSACQLAPPVREKNPKIPTLQMAS